METMKDLMDQISCGKVSIELNNDNNYNVLLVKCMNISITN